MIKRQSIADLDEFIIVSIIASLIFLVIMVYQGAFFLRMGFFFTENLMYNNKLINAILTFICIFILFQSFLDNSLDTLIDLYRRYYEHNVKKEFVCYPALKVASTIRHLCQTVTPSIQSTLILHVYVFIQKISKESEDPKERVDEFDSSMNDQEIRD